MKPKEIRYWWDRSSRNWVVQLVDQEGNQIGDARYSGTPAGRDFDIAFLRRQHSGLPVVKIITKSACKV